MYLLFEMVIVHFHVSFLRAIYSGYNMVELCITPYFVPMLAEVGPMLALGCPRIKCKDRL